MTVYLTPYTATANTQVSCNQIMVTFPALASGTNPILTYSPSTFGSPATGQPNFDFNGVVTGTMTFAVATSQPNQVGTFRFLGVGVTSTTTGAAPPYCQIIVAPNGSWITVITIFSSSNQTACLRLMFTNTTTGTDGTSTTTVYVSADPQVGNTGTTGGC